MAIIDNIPEIQQMLEDPKTTNVELKLFGVATNQNYPRVKIFINHQIVFDDYVINDSELKFQIKNTKQLHIIVEYYNKTAADTIVNNGSIVSNQCVHLDQITINGTKISKLDLASLAKVNYRLTEDQKIIYNKNGYQWKNVQSNSLYNNGTLELQIESPIITNLLNNKKVAFNKFEVPYEDILSKLQTYFRE